MNTQDKNVEDTKKPLIPPHIAWPGLVVGLLFISVGANIGLMMASRSDNGAQPEEGYYQKALAWDATQEARAAGKTLVWDTVFVPQAEHMVFRVKVEQSALTEVRVKYQFNANATWYTQELTASNEGYEGELEHLGVGVWNFIIEANLDGKPVVHEFRQEWRSPTPKG